VSDRKGSMDEKHKYGVGTKHINRNGLEFEIIEYIDYTRRKLKFIKSGFIKISTTGDIGQGSVLDNSSVDLKYDIGKEFLTNEGYKIRIVDRIDSKKVKVMFLDNNMGIVEVNPIAINSGRIRNPYHKSVG
jgi:hypothetical protein